MLIQLFKRSLVVLFFQLALSLFLLKVAYTQDFSNKSYKFGLGLGVNEGDIESGIGFIYSFGLQNTHKNDRFRYGPNFYTGTFLPLGITDVGDQYYKISNLSFNGYADVIRLNTFSVFVGTGLFVNYSRGMIGATGWGIERSRDEFIRKLYYGINVIGGVRIDDPKRKMVLEISPINISFADDYFSTAYFRVGVDLKIKRK